MATARQHQINFLLSAQQNGNFSAVFSKAQQDFARLGGEIRALNKLQADISSYQKQQAAAQNTEAKLRSLEKQYGLIQEEIEAAAGSTAGLEREKAKLEQRIAFLADTFLDIRYHVEVFYEHHFGIIDIDETMRIDETAIC